MWVARRNARLYTFAFADVFQPDIRRTPVCRHVILRDEGGTTLGEGEKGEKRSEGKGGREGKNESYRAALDIEFVLSIVLPSIRRYYVPAYATLECNRYQCFDLRTATRSYDG